MIMPKSGDADELVANLSRHRGRPIQVVEADLEGPSGMWVGLSTMDFILVERSIAPSRRLVTIAHEVAHILLGHGEDTRISDETLAALVPNLSPALVQRVLRRHHHEGEQEREAETMATVISSEMSVRAKLFDIEGHPVSHRLR